MSQSLANPRPELSEFAPRLQTIKIPVDMIGSLIGPGGKNIRQLVKDSGAEVNVEDDGTVTVAAVLKESADKAMDYIRKLTELPEVGKVYPATVKKIMEFGAFVEILPGKEGLVHISQLDTNRVEKVEDLFKVGDALEVKLMAIDPEGRLSLSRKALLPGGENAHEEMKKARERRASSPRDSHRSDSRRR
jgi:polyribonucleotide nucleotidyltransferase